MSTILNRNTDGFIENTGSNEDFISFYSSYPPAFWWEKSILKIFKKLI